MKYRFWLITTEHLENCLWFRDEEDFKIAMNIVAILAASSNLRILAFVLMSNHVHFVVNCSRQEAENFISAFKKRYSQYFQHKYGSRELLRGNSVDIQELRPGDESIERAIAYVQMNPVAANICLNPASYPWGTGNAFFSAYPEDGIPAENLSGRALARILRSRISLPPQYSIKPQGYVSPSSYVNTRLVESFFKSPKRLNYFLQTSSKARRLNDVPSFNDQIVLAGMGSLLASLFKKSDLLELEDQQRAELLRQLRYRFSSDPNQLARISGLSYKETCSLLESL